MFFKQWKDVCSNPSTLFLYFLAKSSYFIRKKSFGIWTDIPHVTNYNHTNLQYYLFLEYILQIFDISEK